MFVVAHSYFLNHDPKQLAAMTPYAPLATLIAAACLRERGHGVRLFDATFAPDVDAFARMLDQTRPSVVALMEDNFNFLTKMCTVRRREDAMAMIALARARGCRIAVNSPDSTDQPALYIAAGADAVILGEGEAGLVELAGRWAADRNARLDDIAGLALPGLGNQLRKARPRPVQRDLDRLPLPPWDLVDAAAYRDAWTARHGRFSWNMATSRGCPYVCNWCAKPTSDAAMSSVRHNQWRRNWRCSTDGRARPHLVRRRHIRADAGMAARVRSRSAPPRCAPTLPDAVARQSDAAGSRRCAGRSGRGGSLAGRRIRLAENSRPDGEGTGIDMVREATRRLKARGIRACWFIQLGYPGESWDDLTATRNLICEERPDDIGVSVAYPLPGTRFHQLVRAQLGARHNWEDSGDLAMLFQGTFETGFYRMVRDLLHDEVRSGRRNDRRWALLGREGLKHRSDRPITLAAGS